MKQYLHQLRSKPDHHKRAIAFGVSCTITGLILVVWLSTFFGDLGSDRVIIAQDDITSDSVVGGAVVLTPIEGLKESVAGVGASLSGLKKLFDKATLIEYKADEAARPE